MYLLIYLCASTPINFNVSARSSFQTTLQHMLYAVDRHPLLVNRSSDYGSKQSASDFIWKWAGLARSSNTSPSEGDEAYFFPL